MEAAIYNIKAQDTGRKADLEDKVFGVEQPNDNAIYQDVKLLLANRRQGTHKAKERGEVSATNKKLYRQKGTGNARAGRASSPLRRHGGTIFGPRPRNYTFKLNKKFRSIARCSALTYKAQEEGLTIIENFNYSGVTEETPAYKTKHCLQLLQDFDLAGAKVLMVVSEVQPELMLSGKNLKNVKVIQATDLNTFDVLNADRLLIEESAVSIINEHFSK